MRSSELIQQLRGIHHLLTVGCLALLIAASMPATRTLEKAFEQARQIQFVTSTMGESLFNLIANDGIDRFRAAGGVIPDIANKSFVLEYSPIDNTGRNSGVAFLAQWLEDKLEATQPSNAKLPFGTFRGPENRDVRVKTAPNQVNTLDDFVRLWNMLHETRYFYATSSISLDCIKELSHDQVGVDIPNCKLINGRFLRLDECAAMASSLAAKHEYVFRGRYDIQWIIDMNSSPQLHKGPENTFLLVFSGLLQRARTKVPCVLQMPISVVRVPVDAQAYIRNKDTRASQWGSGQFDVAFSELAQVSKGLTSLSLAELIGWIEQEIGKTAISTKLFDVEIPRVQIGVWGGLCVVVLQLYLYLCLRMYVNSPRDNVTAPWIGLNNDCLSRCSVVGSANIVPAVVIMWFAILERIESTTSLGGRLILLGTTIASATLSWYTYCLLRDHVWKRQEDVQKPFKGDIESVSCEGTGSQPTNVICEELAEPLPPVQP